MIIRENKCYECNMLFPNTDWYNEGNYIVDETTDEGKILANKIKQHAPYFDFVFDENNNLIDIIPTERPVKIPTEEEINIEVRKKISERYDYAQEIQMLNKGLLDSTDTEYLAYKDYRQSCIDWGIVEKQKYGYI